MLAGIVDHLWQSIGFFLVAWVLAVMLRPNSSVIRAWVWRVAALKFAVPFAWLYHLGAWYGFPVRHSATPPPSVLTDALAISMPRAAPLQALAPTTSVLVMALIVALFVSAACLLRIRRELRFARYERIEEEACLAIDWENRPVAPGLLKTAVLMTVALLSLSIPFVSGGLQDRLLRQAALSIDTHSMMSASISMRESASAFGPIRVDASRDRVEIHRINIKDLVALTYGVGKFEIFGGAMPWMSEPYYDISVVGPVHAPEKFDPYSLRVPMTRFLHDKYGLSIRINGACQEPCDDYQSIVVERLLWCSNVLGAHSTCPK
jgi:hypothetical protein